MTADVTLPAKFAPGDLRKKFGGQFPGVILAAFGDGSVRAIRDTVSERTLQLLFDPADGQVVPSDW